MLKKILRLVLSFCLMTESLGLNAYGAQEAAPSAAQEREQGFENSVFKDPNRFGDGIKLFERLPFLNNHATALTGNLEVEIA